MTTTQIRKATTAQLLARMSQIDSLMSDPEIATSPTADELSDEYEEISDELYARKHDKTFP